MRRILTVCGLLLLVTAVTAAETPDDDMVDPRPGLITADNPLWTLDVLVDNTLVAVGIKSAADVTHKRASEAVVAAEADDIAAVERAVEEVERMAEQAHGINGDGLEAAEQLLLEVRDKVPEEAVTGIDTAIDETRVAQERFPTDLPEDTRIRDRVRDHAPVFGGDQ